jgi:tetratricopeptide (TPR) repeat protein
MRFFSPFANAVAAMPCERHHRIRAASARAKSEPARAGRWRLRLVRYPRWLIGLCLLGAAGCRTVGGGGPVPEAVATCREFSQQGLTAREEGQWAEAERLFAQAVEACPTDVDARRQYAETLWKRGDVIGAARQLEQARKVDPENVALQVRLGEMYLVMRDLDRARRLAERALRGDLRCGDAWALRGRVMRARGDMERALADFHQALRYLPDDPPLLLDLAELYRQRGQPQRALLALDHLANIYPAGEEPQRVLYLLGLAYSALGRHAEAVESLYAASVRGRPTAELLYRLAEAERQAGRPAAARANARQALALDPRHAPSLALYHQLAERPTTRR